ncbi:MAG: hypothetical protein UR93_C0029G0006 [Berkelbacteria bacterium GW2011_GWA2_35_9]|uniref:HicB-like antitoxin of toxin-antitoxin system domain-containing protein n=1 Tax=Berkelbacteria bacterium GW2011_GWA2_35_9 TaxID=1618333 RepID=A0A0G0FK76_9BACT|nr:MAG: hypothetical protein UR93_C0029G0006 [Berkelbacteria bacterium GW2011_GWA2_35_9]
MTKHYKYTVVIEPQEPSGYFVTVPSLPGCSSEGETIEEALTMIKDAIDGYLDVAQEEGISIFTEQNNPIISSVELDRRVRA